MSDHPETAELDINQPIVHPDDSGCVVADCRILLVRSEGPGQQS